MAEKLPKLLGEIESYEGRNERMANLSSSRKDVKDGVPTGLQSDGSLRERVRQATRQIESEFILQALQQHRWNRRRTAEALKISYRLLMYKMKSCNLRVESQASPADGRVNL